ncbi:MAG: hypothetical protein WBA98_17740 [Gordonia sp. (in: high G+C Gram-positive bacteria)]|uniref:DUF6953 family protein n=1 Tax=Gordonia sp. (in: high G+C Gram-positive bacteria) TaxID=84139 RepID=UPI003C77CB7B
MATEQEVAQWMVDEIRQSGPVEQVAVVDAIEAKFGAEFVYEKNGHRAIAKPVLREFRKLHAGSIGWERDDRAWYVREESDKTEADQGESAPE